MSVSAIALDINDLGRLKQLVKSGSRALRHMTWCPGPDANRRGTRNRLPQTSRQLVRPQMTVSLEHFR